MTSSPKVRVMVVDDSSVMRGMVTRVLEGSGIKVAATAASPANALSMLRRPVPHKTEADVLILDVQMAGKAQMPLIAEFRKIAPQMRIIVSATLNEPNVLSSIDALDQGADELVPKPSSRKNPEETANFVQELLRKVKKLAGLPEDKTMAPTRKSVDAPITAEYTITPQEKPDVVFSLRKQPAHFKPKALAIASSTGGPKALQILFDGLGKKLPGLPIFITQHMPKDFTTSLAAQIGRVAGIPCAEGKEEEIVKPGHIYVAPGDYHMLIEKQQNKTFIRLDQGEQENFCRPAADPMLRSLHRVYDKDLLVVILTGMGQDGLLGAQMIADGGGVVIAQDKATSVVWGMPGAAAKAGICTHVLPLFQLADAVVKICNGKQP